MLPSKNSPLWDCQAIYEQLLNPFTQTVGAEYIVPILRRQLQYSKNSKQFLSLAIIKIPGLSNIRKSALNLEGSILSKVISAIKTGLRPTDMLFYDDAQEITFLLPKTRKGGAQKLLDRIKADIEKIYIGNNPLTVKGGYAEFPTDSADFIKLQECAARALGIATQYQESSVIGYFTERRRYTRIPLQIEVRYAGPGTREHITCSRNISEGGIRISGIPELPQGDNIRLTFELPNSMRTKISATAKTIWNRICQRTGKMDLGLCFTNINPDARHMIREVIQGAVPPIVHL